MVKLLGLLTMLISLLGLLQGVDLALIQPFLVGLLMLLSEMLFSPWFKQPKERISHRSAK